MYPNPTSGRVVLLFQQPAKRTLRVYSIRGKLLQKVDMLDEQFEFEISEEPGVYLIEVEEGGRKSFSRIIKT